MGVKIPPQRVDIMAQMNSPVVGLVSIDPGDFARKILPGTPIHITSKDPWESNSPDYLIFEGDAHPEGLEKTPSGVRFSLRVYDYSYLWNIVAMSFVDLSKGMDAIKDALVARMKGQNREFTVSTLQSTFSQSINAMGKSGEKYTEAILYLLDLIATSSPVYFLMHNRLNTFDRIYFRDFEKEFTKILDAQTIQEILKQRTLGRSGVHTAWGTLMSVLSAMYHDFSSIVGPSLIKTRDIKRDPDTREVLSDRGKKQIKFVPGQKSFKIGSYYIKPELTNCVPPTCNVIFPSQNRMMAQRRRWITEPTRYSALSTDYLGQDFFSRAKYSLRPLDLLYFMTKYGQPKPETDVPEDSKKLKKSMRITELRSFGNFLYFNNEEMMRGIITTQRQSFLQGAYNVKLSSDKNYEFGDATCDFEFQRSQNEGRALSMEGDLNYRPVQGYPTVILDGKSNGYTIYGDLVSLRHLWDSQGVQSTGYNVDNVRYLDEEDLNLPVIETLTIGKTTKKVVKTDKNGFPVFLRKKEPEPPTWMGNYIEKNSAKADENSSSNQKPIVLIPKYKATTSTIYAESFGPFVKGITHVVDNRTNTDRKDSASEFSGIEKIDFLSRKNIIAGKPNYDSVPNYDDDTALPLLDVIRLLESKVQSLGDDQEAQFQFIASYTRRNFVEVLGPEKFKRILKEGNEQNIRMSFEGINGLIWSKGVSDVAGGSYPGLKNIDRLVANKDAKGYQGPFVSYVKENSQFDEYRKQMQKIVQDAYKEIPDLINQLGGGIYTLITEEQMLDIKLKAILGYINNIQNKDIFRV